MNKQLDTYNAPKLPANVMDGDDPNLAASGIIDADETEVLIELGDKPYLLHKKLRDDGMVAKWEGLTRFASLDKVPNRVATIESAQALVKDPEGMDQLCSLWWAEEQPSGFRPPDLEEQYVKVLASPVSPLAFGFRLDECGVAPAGTDDDVSALVPAGKTLDEPHTQRAKSYITARDTWNAACEKIKSRTPLEYEGLSTKKNRYSYHANHNDRVGMIVRTPVGVFIQGTVQNKDNWDDVTRLDKWHRLHAKLNRVKLG
jgi:hypothetical protein